MVPRIDVFRCDGCGLCIKACPPKVMGLIQNKAVILVDLCEECGICHDACPIDAVHFRLPNQAVEQVHAGYKVVREFTPNPGNWRTRVPLGVDGEGNAK